MNKYEYDYDVDLYHAANPLAELKIVPLLQAILYQAVYDAIKLNAYGKFKEEKLDATQWLCNEDDRMLQLCLQCVNIDHSRLLKKIAKEGWNLDL